MESSVRYDLNKKWTKYVWNSTNPIIDILYGYTLDEFDREDINKHLHNLDKIRQELCEVSEDRRDADYRCAVILFNGQLSEIKNKLCIYIHIDIEPIYLI